MIKKNHYHPLKYYKAYNIKKYIFQSIKTKSKFKKYLFSNKFTHLMKFFIKYPHPEQAKQSFLANATQDNHLLYEL